MAAVGSLRMQVEKTGVSVTVPNNAKARLMYYLNSVCNVLEVGNDAGSEINRLKNYRNYTSLSADETDQLFLMCLMLSPDILINKCFFQDDAMCGDRSNEFYKITAVQNRFVVSHSIMIAGRNRSVNKIMTFKMSWLRQNYLEPIETLKNEMEARNRRQRQRQASNDSCTVM
ncbi:hypothetical protein KP79_PYT04839 [Mizuhopecten yessoensis]|uniref:Uncharacterized protein n=1 Tax=Mizuhopecten yessoensis TaxID=6573 RepID=A0A210Q1R6_MIZYE|nr:hypothetical protein KP79_PYT04839 [Mizuhopecten yessoensis]